MEKVKGRAARLARMAFLFAKAKLAAMVRWAKPRLSAVWAKSKAMGMYLAVALSLASPALATGESGSGSSGLSEVVAATDTVTSMVSKAWGVMMANPLLTVYVAAGLLSVGIGFFARFRWAARG